MLKNSPKAVATTKKGNVPFEGADLASIMLAALPLMWQNQNNLMHSTEPESPCALLADLEAGALRQETAVEGQGCYSPS
jgi:hypothetical protein